jgi:hypothetical protein
VIYDDTQRYETSELKEVLFEVFFTVEGQKTICFSQMIERIATLALLLLLASEQFERTQRNLRVRVHQRRIVILHLS